MSLSNETCLIRPTLIDLNLIEINYYQFMISLDKFNGSCNVVENFSTEIIFPGETKDVNYHII